MKWDFFSGLAIFYSIIEVPFRIGFQSPPTYSIIVLNYIVDAIFFTDILLAFHTAYISKLTDALVTDRKLIRRNYMKCWFWIDVASTLPFDQIAVAASSSVSNAHVSTLRLIRVLRLVRLIKLIKVIHSRGLKDLLESFNINSALVSIVSLLLQIFVIAHIVCCFWFFITTPDAIGLVQPDENSGLPYAIRTWVTEFEFQYSDLSTQYIASLYWAFATMLTVGYGDIHATNTGERFYAFVTMLLGSLMFGAIIAKVRMLVESRNLQSKELKTRVAEFKAYLEERRIPIALKKEARVRLLFPRHFRARVLFPIHFILFCLYFVLILLLVNIFNFYSDRIEERSEGTSLLFYSLFKFCFLFLFFIFYFPLFYSSQGRPSLHLLILNIANYEPKKTLITLFTHTGCISMLSPKTILPFT